MSEHVSQVKGAEPHHTPAVHQPDNNIPTGEAPQSAPQDALELFVKRATTGSSSGAGAEPPPTGKGTPTLLQRRQAALLGDPRLRQPMYAQRRAELFLQLQRIYGNTYARQVASLVKEQTRLQMPHATDHEAPAQRTASAEGDETEEAVPAQRSSSAEGGEQGDVAAEIRQSQGGGEHLDPTARAKLEPAMGVDLGHVNIHADSQADTLSRSVQAEAFTTGNDVYFRSGRYDPHSEGGLHLLAHELTHTVQQSKGAVSGTQHSSGVSVSDPDDSFEREAEVAY